MAASGVVEGNVPAKHSVRVEWFGRDPGGSTVFVKPPAEPVDGPDAPPRSRPEAPARTAAAPTAAAPTAAAPTAPATISQ